MRNGAFHMAGRTHMAVFRIPPRSEIMNSPGRERHQALLFVSDQNCACGRTHPVSRNFGGGSPGGGASRRAVTLIDVTRYADRRNERMRSGTRRAAPYAETAAPIVRPARPQCGRRDGRRLGQRHGQGEGRRGYPRGMGMPTCGFYLTIAIFISKECAQSQRIDSHYAR